MKTLLLKISAPMAVSAPSGSGVGARFKSIIIQQVGKVALSVRTAAVFQSTLRQAGTIRDAMMLPTGLRLATPTMMAGRFTHGTGQLLTITTPISGQSRRSLSSSRIFWR